MKIIMKKYSSWYLISSNCSFNSYFVCSLVSILRHSTFRSSLYLVFHNNFTSSIIVAMSTYSRKPILASAHKFSNFLELTLTKRFLDSNSFSFEVHTLPEVFATALLQIEFFFYLLLATVDLFLSQDQCTTSKPFQCFPWLWLAYHLLRNLRPL
jgi:hypothetical protein